MTAFGSHELIKGNQQLYKLLYIVQEMLSKQTQLER